MMHKNDLEYLQAFILEVFRYAPVVPMSARKAKIDVKMAHFVIPKGVTVNI